MKRRNLLAGATALALLVVGCKYSEPAPGASGAAGVSVAPPASAPAAQASETIITPLDPSARAAQDAEAYAQHMQELIKAQGRADASTGGKAGAANDPKATSGVAGSRGARPVVGGGDEVPPLPEKIAWLEKPYELQLTGKQEEGSKAPATAVVVPAVAIKPARAESTNELELKLAGAVKASPRDLNAHLDQQLVELVQGRQVPQMESIAELPVDDREIVAALMDGLTNFRAIVKANGDALAATKVRPLVEMADRLRTSASLRISVISLCARVDGFGQYEPIDASRLPAGREQAMVLYCELENFVSRMGASGLWQTDLTQEAILYNDAGQRVWEEKKTVVSEQSRSRRHDFFVARRVRIPGTLAPGTYRLKVAVTDQQANRAAESSLAVVVVGK